ncbi:ATP-binding protein [Acinetobacter nosocomialis]|uniref:ATP-binding protein n=1 Tax=Acinetobacter nosocomialis TaxID=106654 RepID=UPI001250A2F0|nr:ATP-binding protein [Acinetobacter nosocomialis]
MENKVWDPLASGREADTEIVSAAQKREIKNILKSYVGMYDSFSELIQNAMDAVDRRKKNEIDQDYKRKIWLTINLKENSFLIVDNGTGFNEKEFQSFLAPNISFKNHGDSRGNKGVGATYIGYGFNKLNFGTKNGTYEFIGELKNGRNWVEDYKGVVTRPIVTQSDFKDDDFNAVDRGSIFKLFFGGENTRPKDLAWYMATTPEQWLYLLLTKTPLGTIRFLDSEDENIFFNLKVIDKNGTENILESQLAEYIFPHVKIKASVNLKEVLDYQKKLLEANKDPTSLPQRYFHSNGIYEFFSTNELCQLLKQKDIELIEQYNVEAYGYFTYSTSVWDELNDNKAKLRKGYRVLRGGLQLANNKMIQGEVIVIPLTSNIGYQNQTHVVIHFKDADPDLGRKGFQPELKEIAEKISVQIVNKFKNWKKLLKNDSGTKPDIDKEIELHEWVRAQENHEQTNPLRLTNQNFFLPVNEISIVSEPQSEQDVIVLFNQLIAGGVIRGIKLYATSQIKQYDGIFKFTIKEPVDNHIFDIEKNPLGIDDSSSLKEVSSPPKILEYKYNLDALIGDFESEYKNEKEIHLTIVWEVGNEWKKNYDIISYLDLDNLHQRRYHGITHLLTSGTSSFYLIALKELIEYLNNTQGVQDQQKKKYSNDIF